MCSYFYPRSPCGERRDVIAVMTDAQSISIHALLAESDVRRLPWQISIKYFYPRSPCGERLVWVMVCIAWVVFLSTLSLRRATGFGGFKQRRIDISIHALLAESDYLRFDCWKAKQGFLSTLSLRRATVMDTLILADAMLFLSTLSLRRATYVC